MQHLRQAQEQGRLEQPEPQVYWRAVSYWEPPQERRGAGADGWGAEYAPCGCFRHRRFDLHRRWREWALPPDGRQQPCGYWYHQRHEPEQVRQAPPEREQVPGQPEREQGAAVQV